MEDALVHYIRLALTLDKPSLNPCFNGRCTRTAFAFGLSAEIERVLILVLMEDALVPTRQRVFWTSLLSLNPCFNGRCTRTTKGLLDFIAKIESVLILVLMEDALVQYQGHSVRHVASES